MLVPSLVNVSFSFSLSLMTQTAPWLSSTTKTVRHDLDIAGRIMAWNKSCDWRQWEGASEYKDRIRIQVKESTLETVLASMSGWEEGKHLRALTKLCQDCISSKFRVWISLKRSVTVWVITMETVHVNISFRVTCQSQWLRVKGTIILVRAELRVGDIQILKVKFVTLKWKVSFSRKFSCCPFGIKRVDKVQISTITRWQNWHFDVWM